MKRTLASLFLLALSSLACSKTPTFVDDGPKGAPCELPSDCPGLETECATRTCSAGICGKELHPLGYLVGVQSAGDCVKVACDGEGNAVPLPDDADVPNDGNDCTDDRCEAGAPVKVGTPSGSPCGNGLTCDGAGQCTGCTTASECGTDTPCLTLGCNDSVCVFDYVPDGQGDPGGQLAGDCHVTTCNGMGGAKSNLDTTDVPVDGNPCTNDVCNGGLPANPPTAGGIPCGGSFTCDGQGSCSGCATSADCGVDSACATFTCQSGACHSTFTPDGAGDPGGQQSGNCQKVVCDGQGGAKTIPDDGDLPVDGNACTGDVCSGGVPSNPALGAGTACGGGQCDGGGSCVGCLGAGDCGQATACKTPTCSGGNCGMSYVPFGQGDPGGQSGGDCHRAVCDGSGGTTLINDDADAPNDGNACTQDSCSGGSFVFTPIAPVDDGNPCTSEVCDPASGQTIHSPVGDGTNCGSCQTCYAGTCYSDCSDCEYCAGTYCQQLCGFCEYCSGGGCYYDPYCFNY